MPAGSAISVFTILGLATLAFGVALPEHHNTNPTSRAVHARRHARLQERNSGFSLADSYKGNNFFDGFDFFNDADPTHGMVDYVNRDEAFSRNLSFINAQGQAVIRVDKTTYLGPGQNRKSVRLQSKKTYGNSLIVLDLATMPHGCSVWPAFWTTSAAQQWPQGGEIDILEGVNEMTNQMTLHTRPGCVLDTAAHVVKQFTGKILATNCDAAANGNAGCGVSDPEPKSYGHEFNINGGGVFATLTDSTGIRIWRFNRDQVPQDLLNGDSPNPEGWPAPKAFWASSTCARDFIDQKQQMIFDITLCGDWAGAPGVFSSMGCPGTCADMVMNPDNYKWARFIVNSLRVFKHNS